MLKYIYVFILIIILFWIKWKLQKKYEFKEEFTAANTLADMFSSSSSSAGTNFYDKLNLLKSNINIDVNKIIFNRNHFLLNDPTNKYTNLVNLYVDIYGNMNLQIKNVSLYVTAGGLYSIWNISSGHVVSLFKRNLRRPMKSINTSMKDLLDWHVPA